MKKVIIRILTISILSILVTGVCLCLYILQAPPVAEPGAPKLQVHTRTSFRKRPTINSRPFAKTKDVYRFNLERKYISNLNSGQFLPNLLFSAALGHRAALRKAELDTALASGIDWQKIFSDLTENAHLSSASYTIKVLLTGKEWLLTDGTGAGYTVVRVRNQLDIYLPNLVEQFDINRIQLSDDVESVIAEAGKLWMLKDKKYQQTYEIRNGPQKLAVYQQSKYPIVTELFKVDVASQTALAEGKFSDELRKEFENLKIPLSRNAKLTAEPDGISWFVSDSPQKYSIRKEAEWLQVYLELDSEWLLIRGDANLKGWVQRERGAIIQPPPPVLSSRQLAKKRLLALADKIKEKIGRGDEKDEENVTEEAVP